MVAPHQRQLQEYQHLVGDKVVDINTSARVIDSSLHSQIQNWRLFVCDLPYPEEKLVGRNVITDINAIYHYS